eukprot:Pompholyxophrys_punicea_v1_NODE_377_length_2100_cov_32.452812.p1 type:complete len:273 gc:universal NODE_377_length_2100_cov_32.452812:993-175(-)
MKLARIFLWIFAFLIFFIFPFSFIFYKFSLRPIPCLSFASEYQTCSADDKFCVVVAAHCENLDWIHERPHFPFAIYSHAKLNESSNLQIVPNVGNEATMYLTYIVENYENFPNIAVFVHGAGPFDAHINPPGIFWSRLDYLYSLRFENLSFYKAIPCCFECDKLTSTDACMRRPPYMPMERFSMRFFWYWIVGGQLKPPKNWPPLFNSFASFAVTRDRVHVYPKSLYRFLLTWIKTTWIESYFSGRYFEYSWATLFTKDQNYEEVSFFDRNS